MEWTTIIPEVKEGEQTPNGLSYKRYKDLWFALRLRYRSHILGLDWEKDGHFRISLNRVVTSKWFNT